MGMRILHGIFLLLFLVAAAGSARAAGPVRVLIAPITMYTPEEQPFLRNGLIEMLASRLRTQPGIRVSVLGDSQVVVSNANTARELARGRGADYVLFGSFTQFGDGVSLDLQCVAATSSATTDASRGVFVKSSSFKDFIRDLDDLAARVSTFVLPAGASLAPTASGGGGSALELRELERRVEKLERELHALQKEAATRAAPPPAPGAREAR